MVPFPLPVGVTVHQVWSLVTVQAELEATEKGVVPADAETLWFGGVTVRVGKMVPAWVTVTITGESPVTVTVILATRDAGSVFAL